MYISEIFTSAPGDIRIPLETETYKLLEKLNIPYERVDNDSVSSMDECIEISNILGAEIRKSIFLCNKKKTQFYLVIMPADKAFSTSDFCAKLNCDRVSFASEEYMLKHLGVTPGSVTVMGLLNDKDDYVKCIVDKDVSLEEWFCCNPGINTSHIKFKTTDLINTLLPHLRHKPQIIEL